MPSYRQAVPYFATGNPDTEEMSSLYAPGMLGCLAEFNQGTSAAPNICVYQLVKAAASITPVNGGVCIWSTKTAFTITDVVTNAGLLCGISPRLVSAAAYYFWAIKHGDKSVLFVDAPTSACAVTGNPAVVSGTTAKADALAIGTAPTIGRIGACTSVQDGTSKLATVRIDIMDRF